MNAEVLNRKSFSLNKTDMILKYSSELILVTEYCGYIRFASPSSAKILGCAPEDLISKNIFDFIHPDDIKTLKTVFTSGDFGFGNSVSLEIYFKNIEETYICLSVIVNNFLYDEDICGILITAIDISERKKSEQEIIKLSSALKQSPGIVIITDPDGFIEYANPKFTEITGYTFDEVKGINPRLFRSGYHNKDFYRKLWNTITKGKEWKGEILNKKKNGDLYWELASISSIKDKNGKIIYYLKVSEDITERKKIEIELQIAKDEAEEANKAKSEFLANMSHEIRTPMNAIIGLTDLVLKSNLSNQQKKYLEMIRSSGESLLGIINDILDFSKIEAGKIEIEMIPFNIREIVENTVETFAIRAHQKSIELICITDEMHETLIGDPTKLKQIIVNLLGNALKFTEKGQIAVLVTKISETEESCQFKISVQDSGIGIPESKKDKLFKSFSQVDSSTTRKFGGTGLGLAICKKFVELMNGEISVESEENKGSTFYFTLTLNKEKSILNKEYILPPEIQDMEIVVLDDNSLQRDSICRNLTAFGLKSYQVPSEKILYDYIKEYNYIHKKFDIVFIDARIPNTDSYKLAKKIHEIEPATKIVLMVDSDMTFDNNYDTEFPKVIKPIKRVDLIESILSIENIATIDSINKNSDNIKFMKKDGSYFNLLLAEDNPINQELAIALLTNKGFSVTKANNGKEAFELYKKNNYDLILMDVQMPEMDGFEASIKIREYEKTINKNIPIIAMTAFALEEDKRKCFLAGMNGYITKPIKVNELLDEIRKFIDATVLVERKELPKQEEVVTELEPESDVSYKNVIETLSMFSEDKNVLKGFMDSFLNYYPALLVDIEKSVQESDYEVLKIKAHELKGLCGNFGITECFDLSFELEKMGRTEKITPNSKGIIKNLKILLDNLNYYFRNTDWLKNIK